MICSVFFVVFVTTVGCIKYGTPVLRIKDGGKFIFFILFEINLNSLMAQVEFS